MIFGEITPTVASVDEVTPFTYVMTPVMRSGNFGFDRIRIDTPTTVAGIDGVRFNGQPVAYEVDRLDESGFEIAIPRVDESRDGELIEIDFRSRIFRFGTVFSGRVMDSQRPEEVAQVVSPGEADPIVDSNTLSVGLEEVGRRTVNALTVEPPVFSPNGDGINDRMSLEYELVNVEGDAEVAVVLYDLRGSPLEEVFRGPAGSGRFRAEWGRPRRRRDASSGRGSTSCGSRSSRTSESGPGNGSSPSSTRSRAATLGDPFHPAGPPRPGRSNLDIPRGPRYLRQRHGLPSRSG